VEVVVTSVDELLSSYSVSRDTAIAYVDAIVRMNQTDCAEEIGVTRPTVNRFKKAFANMSDEERAFLIASLFDERWRELVREED
jgi:DNA-binding XRE family transcriptional regulator